MRWLWLSAVALLFLTGCSSPVIFAEVFQLKENQKLYTRYNIWYTNPDEISCLNIQRGSFIPLGTQVIPVSADSARREIIFKDSSGKVYNLKFNPGYRLCTLRDFMVMTFTTETPKELLSGISPKVQARILRGEVVPGMNQREVMLAYGPPPAIRTPDLRNETWFYFLTQDETIRLIFRGDQVRSVLNINQ